jgi:serine/threonine protein kinase
MLTYHYASHSAVTCTYLLTRFIDFLCEGKGLCGRAQEVVTSKSPGCLQRFMSPEQLQGMPRSADGDVWAAGALLFYLLCGREPFPLEGAREQQLWQLRMMHAPESLAWPLECVSPSISKLKTFSEPVVYQADQCSPPFPFQLQEKHGKCELLIASILGCPVCKWAIQSGASILTATSINAH